MGLIVFVLVATFGGFIGNSNISSNEIFSVNGKGIHIGEYNLEANRISSNFDESQNFINTGTSPGDLAAYYCNTNQIIVGDDRIQNRTRFTDTILGKRDKKVFRFEKERNNFDELFLFLKENT